MGTKIDPGELLGQTASTFWNHKYSSASESHGVEVENR